MNLEKIQQTLQQLFDDDARWQDRFKRVVFWYDENAVFAEEYEALNLEKVRKHTLNDHNTFYTKVQLEALQAGERCLVYSPMPQPHPEENWLLDALKYGESFSADRASLVFTELGLLDRSLLDYIRDHLKFFQNKKRVEALMQLMISPSIQEPQLRIAMMSVLTGLKTPDALGMIRKVLLAGLEDENPLWELITSFMQADEFWNICQEELGYVETGDFAPSLKRLFLKLAVTHFSHGFQGRFPVSLQDFVIHPSHIPFKFVDDWLHHAEDSPSFKRLSQQASEDLQILALVLNLDVSQYQECDTFLAFDQGIIRSLVQDLKAKTESYSRLRELIQRRQTQHWHQECENLYQALLAAIHLFETYRQGVLNHLPTQAKALFETYAHSLYQLDQAYRHYFCSSDAAASHDIIKSLSQDVENLYVNGYLQTLSKSWDRALEQELISQWEISGIKSQERFFKTHVQPILDRSDKEKVFVIISDALRYEVAAELADVLTQKLRGQAQLDFQLGVLPSVTKLGMAALLPHEPQSLSFDGSGNVLLAGQSTQGLEARKTILEQAGKNWQGTALKARDLLDMTVTQGRDLLQPYRVIYLYHDRIDMTGDKLASEPLVFQACQDTIQELTSLVSRITKSLNGTHVMITADHGFLYQRQELEDADKIALPNLKVIDRTKRSLVAADSHAIEGTFQKSLQDIGDSVNSVWVPRGNLRFKIQGGSRQFVHGGASLQEICVPVLKYKDVRLATGDTGPNRKVGVQVNARHKRITNNKFTLRLLQIEPIKDKVIARRIKVGFYDPQNEYSAITNEKIADLNLTSGNPIEREIKLSMTVAVTQTNAQSDYYLIIKDAEDGTELLREPWKVNLGIINDFGFDI